jgi:hypothetical protein
MDLLQETSTSNWLSFEGDENEREKWDQRATEESVACRAIEDAFAAAMGQNAMKQLEQARNKWFDLLDFDDFTYDGVNDDDLKNDAPRRRRQKESAVPHKQASPRKKPHTRTGL